MSFDKVHATKCLESGGSFKGHCNCDGYHTWDELYEHRIRLFIALCKYISKTREVWEISHRIKFPVWYSKKHHDGSKFEGWFIMGMCKDKGKQISYHLPLRFWDEVSNWAEELESAPEWDGHTSDDVLERLKHL